MMVIQGSGGPFAMLRLQHTIYLHKFNDMSYWLSNLMSIIIPKAISE